MSDIAKEMVRRRAEADPTITIGGREYRRFIPYPKKVRDGTVRCISCGQIDEPEYHVDYLCAYDTQPRSLSQQEEK